MNIHPGVWKFSIDQRHCFASQVDFVFFEISVQSHLKISDSNSEFEKYNSSDSELVISWADDKLGDGHQYY